MLCGIEILLLKSILAVVLLYANISVLNVNAKYWQVEKMLEACSSRKYRFKNKKIYYSNCIVFSICKSLTWDLWWATGKSIIYWSWLIGPVGLYTETVLSYKYSALLMMFAGNDSLIQLLRSTIKGPPPMSIIWCYN